MESGKVMGQIHPGAHWGMLACSPKASCDIVEIDGATFQKKLKHLSLYTNSLRDEMAEEHKVCININERNVTISQLMSVLISRGFYNVSECPGIKDNSQLCM